MGKVKIKLSYEGIGQMLRGGEMKALVEEYASATVSRAGAHYGYRVHNTGQRQAANVFPTDYRGSRDNLTNNTLLKCVK